MAVAILGYMVLVLLASIAVPIMRRKVPMDWRLKKGIWGNQRALKLPVRVDTIAGCMWYVCDSAMLKDFEVSGMGGFAASRRDRDRLVREMGRRYMLGEVVGVSTGGRRVGVDYYRDLGGGRDGNGGY